MGLGYILFLATALYLLYIDKKHKDLKRYKHIHYLVEFNPETGKLITAFLADKTVEGLNADGYSKLVDKLLTNSNNKFAFISNELTPGIEVRKKWYTHNASISNEMLIRFSLTCSRIDVV